MDGKRNGRRLGICALAAVALLGLGLAAWATTRGPAEAEIEFTDVRRQTEEFMEYERNIELTPSQEAVRRDALSDIPAPCCADRSAYTCCCPCNLTKTIWGLSKHLITHEGRDADAVRAAAKRWIAFVNPRGFTGNACYTGGCNRPFDRNGCGGMEESHVRF